MWSSSMQILQEVPLQLLVKGIGEMIKPNFKDCLPQSKILKKNTKQKFKFAKNRGKKSSDETGHIRVTLRAN